MATKLKTIRLKKQLSDEEVDDLAGTFLDDSRYDVLISGENVDIYTPEGEPLIKFRSKVLPKGECEAAYQALRQVNFGSANRGTAGGRVEGIKDGDVLRRGPKEVGRGSVFKPKGQSQLRMHPLKKDGTLSNTEYAAIYASGNQIPSGIIGYFDRYPRIPYCRMTAFSLDHPEAFLAALPFIRSIDKTFAKEMPERYVAQMEMIQKTSQDFVINRTVFTTLTVNRNWQTAVHKDAGDLREGFGVMSALRSGKYKGGYLVFPKYRVAVDMSTGDVCLADVHQWHGNTKILGHEGAYERISVVCYYRAKMVHCLSASEEERRAATRKRGEKLND